MPINLFDTVKAAVTPRMAAERYGLPIQQGNMICCPFHADRTPSMKLNEEYFYCFGCGAHGDVVALTAQLFDLPPAEAAKKLAADFGIAEQKPSVLTKLKRSKSQAELESRSFRVLGDYLQILQDWKAHCAPQSPEDAIDPRYAEACHMLERIGNESKNLYLLPAYLNLAGVDMELIELERKAKENGEKFNRVIRLKEELGKISDNFDYILIDCPPSLGILTTNALAAANSVLIPVQCEYFALEGIMQLINTIMLAQRKVNPNLDIEGVLLTMFSNTNLGIEVIESIKGFFKERVYNTIIPRLVRLAEAPSHGKPILEYEPRNKGTIAYLNLAKEVIERNGTEKESPR